MDGLPAEMYDNSTAIGLLLKRNSNEAFLFLFFILPSFFLATNSTIRIFLLPAMDPLFPPH